MRYVKMFSLGAAVVAAAMAFAATASATTLTAPAGTTYTGTIAAESEGSVTIHGAPGNFSCVSKGLGEITKHGTGVTVSGPVTQWEFSNCSGGSNLKIRKNGTLEIHATGSGNGTVTSSGVEIEAEVWGLTCIYTTSNTDIGVLTGNNSGKATLHAAAQVPRTGGSVFCGSTGQLTGSYTVNTPSTLYVD